MGCLLSMTLELLNEHLFYSHFCQLFCWTSSLMLTCMSSLRVFVCVVAYVLSFFM